MQPHDTPSVRIPLRSRKYPGLFAVVDEADLPLVSFHQWSVHTSRGTFYAVRYVKGKIVWMHRVILGLSPGDGFEGDHINHDGLDNRRSNLRVCTHAQNSSNRRIQSNNTSGFKGVTWSSLHKKWRVQLISNGKRMHLGLFDDPEEAARVYDAGAVEVHGEFAHLNFPKSNASDEPALTSKGSRSCHQTERA